MKAARSEQRNTTTFAMSSGWPRRFNGVCSIARASSPGTAHSGSVSFVAMDPGEIALTRIDGAYSNAAVAVSATTPAFAAAYGASPAAGRTPLIDAVLTMLPPPLERISGAAALMPLNTPVRFRRIS